MKKDILHEHCKAIILEVNSMLDNSRSFEENTPVL
jgi:hypothetical protein